jgi:hypothetical protein
MPRRARRRALHDQVERLLPDLRRRVGEQGGDRGLVVDRGDGVGDLAGDARALRDRGDCAGDRRAGDDLDQVVVGEQRRAAQHRLGHHQLDVFRQPADHVGGRVSDVLQGLGKDLAHAHRGVAAEGRHQVEDAFARLALLVFRQVRQQRRDLARKVGAHRLVGVAHQQQVGLRRRVGIRGDFAPHRRRRVARQIIEDLGPRLVAARERLAHLDVGIGGKPLVALVGRAAHVRPPAGGATPKPFLVPCLTPYIAASARRISASPLSGVAGW